MKEYSSFEEVDRDLNILELQTEIDKEEIKLSMDEVKGNLTPMSLLRDSFGAIARKALVLKAASKIFGLKKK